MFHNKDNLPLERFSGKDTTDIDTTANNHHYVPNCTLQIQKQMLHSPIPEPPIKKKRKSPEEKYPEAYKEAVSGIVTNHTFKTTYHKRLKERPILIGYTDLAEYFCRPAMIKGDHNYNRKLMVRVCEKANQLAKLYKYIYFHTETYDVETYGENLIEGWRTFRHHISLTAKTLRKHLKFGYVDVFESTAKGRPHSHCIIATNDEAFATPDGVLAGKKITFGKMYNLLNSIVHSPIHDLRKGDTRNLGGYVAKYMVKSSLENEKLLTKKDSRLKSSDRKALLSILMPILSGIRQVRCSIRENSKPAKESEDFSEDLIYKMTTDIELGQRWLTNDEDLIHILTKLPCCTRDKYFMITDKLKKHKLKDYLSWYSHESLPDLDFYLQGSRHLQCPGCFIRDIYLKLVKTVDVAPKPITNPPSLSPLKEQIEKGLDAYYKQVSNFCIDKNNVSVYITGMMDYGVKISNDKVILEDFIVPARKSVTLHLENADGYLSTKGASLKARFTNNTNNGWSENIETITAIDKLVSYSHEKQNVTFFNPANYDIEVRELELSGKMKINLFGYTQENQKGKQAPMLPTLITPSEKKDDSPTPPSLYDKVIERLKNNTASITPAGEGSLCTTW